MGPLRLEEWSGLTACTAVAKRTLVPRGSAASSSAATRGGFAPASPARRTRSCSRRRTSRSSTARSGSASEGASGGSATRSGSRGS